MNELENVRACLQHYADEIRDYIEDDGYAPRELNRYTCGADYEQEANINPKLFAEGIRQINAAARPFRFAATLREVIDSTIRNFF